MRFACERPRRRIGPSCASEVYLLVARKDQKLGLVVPEQPTTGLIETQSTADYPLYLPAGWEVAKVQDCHFVPHGPPRLVPCQKRVAVHVVSASRAGESLALPRGEALGATAADTTPGPGGVGWQCLGRSGDLRSDRTATGDLSGDASRHREMNSAERARTADREVRPTRPKPVSPDPDRTPAPAAESVKPYQITEEGYSIPRLPSPSSCLTPEEPSELQHLLHEYRDRLATNLLKAPLDTGNIDDIIVYSDKCADQLAHLRRLFEALRKANLSPARPSRLRVDRRVRPRVDTT